MQKCHAFYMYSLAALLTLKDHSKFFMDVRLHIKSFLIGELFLSETLELNSIRSLSDARYRPYCTSKTWRLFEIENKYDDCQWPESYN